MDVEKLVLEALDRANGIEYPPNRGIFELVRTLTILPPETWDEAEKIWWGEAPNYDVSIPDDWDDYQREIAYLKTRVKPTMDTNKVKEQVNQLEEKVTVYPNKKGLNKLIALCHLLAGEDGTFSMANKWVAIILDSSELSARAWIRRLKEDKWIKVSRRGNMHQANQYMLLLRLPSLTEIDDAV